MIPTYKCSKLAACSTGELTRKLCATCHQKYCKLCTSVIAVSQKNVTLLLKTQDTVFLVSWTSFWMYYPFLVLTWAMLEVLPTCSYLSTETVTRTQYISCILSRCPVSHWQCLVRSLSVLEFTHLDMQQLYNWFSWPFWRASCIFWYVLKWRPGLF